MLRTTSQLQMCVAGRPTPCAWIQRGVCHWTTQLILERFNSPEMQFLKAKTCQSKIFIVTLMAENVHKFWDAVPTQNGSASIAGWKLCMWASQMKTHVLMWRANNTNDTRADQMQNNCCNQVARTFFYCFVVQQGGIVPAASVAGF